MIFDFQDVIMEIVKYLNVVDTIVLSMSNTTLRRWIHPSDHRIDQFQKHRKMITAGHYYTLFIKNHKVYMAGSLDAVKMYYRPTPLTTLYQPISIHAQNHNALIWCRDNVYYVKLNNFMITTIALGINSVIGIATGHAHTLILTDTGLFMMQAEKIVKCVFFDTFTIIKMDCGLDFSVVLTTEGLYGFGNNCEGQIGHEAKPVGAPLLMTTMTDIVDVVCGGKHTIIVTTDACYGLGNNAWGQLGLGYVPRVKELTVLPIQNVVHVACGCYFTMVLTDQQQLYVTGDGFYGQLGSSYFRNNLHHFERIDIKMPIMGITCGLFHTIVNNDRELWVTGLNRFGALGLGTYTNKKYHTFTKLIF